MSNLGRFLRRVKRDTRIGPRHISLYVVLLDTCKSGCRPGLFVIDRLDVMAKAKISSPGTYYTLMKDLADWGYVVYQPRCGGKKRKVGIVGKCPQNSVKAYGESITKLSQRK